MEEMAGGATDDHLNLPLKYTGFFKQLQNKVTEMNPEL